jgi:glycosyltransferase involved in cell wall biosynthesis
MKAPLARPADLTGWSHLQEREFAMMLSPGLAPTISVIIPARHCAKELRQCLASLERSLYRDFEIIVVDDASTDDTAQGIEPSRARVLRMATQSGPAAARNSGATIARGEYLLFLDADVCIHPETLGEIAKSLDVNPAIAAVFGSYDTQPRALNILSQYRNLMHHFVHQEACTEASTFWSGCGAVRRTVFLAVGGFETDYRRPCIEDIELGVRLHRAGHRILLNKQIQVTHLKRWTLWDMLKADIRDRAYPWSQLILRAGSLPNDLNLRISQRASALLAVGLLGSLLFAAYHLRFILAGPVVFVIGLILLDSWSRTRRVPNSVRYLAVLAMVGITAGLAYYYRLRMLIPLGLLLGILVLNWRFYVFLARSRHPLFAALAFPLQILYYLYSLATFCLAVVVHLLQSTWAFWRQATMRTDRTRGGRLLPHPECPKNEGSPLPISQDGRNLPQILREAETGFMPPAKNASGQGQPSV